MYKRLAMLILAGILSVGSVTLQVPYTAQTAYAQTVNIGSKTFNLSKQAFSDMWKLQDRLKIAALDGGGTVDVSDLNTDAVDWYFGHGYKEIDSHINPYFRVKYSGVGCTKLSGNTVQVLVQDLAKANKTFAELDSIMNAFKSGLSDSMSDEDKVVYIAKFLNTYKITHDVHRTSVSSKTAGDFLLNNTDSADCSGWMFTADYLGMMAGLTIKNVSAMELNHGWNVVNVDGDWYHCDFYWGYILQSDNAINRLEKHRTINNFVCSNTKYDGKYGDTSTYPAESGCFSSILSSQPRTLTLSRQSFTMDTGTTYPLSYANYPLTKANESIGITWTSSTPSVATVSNGKVTGVSAGTATITAKTADGLIASCTVTVSSKGTESKPSVDTDINTTTIKLWLTPTLVYGSHKVIDLIYGVGHSTYGRVESLPIPTMEGYKFVGWYTYSGNKKITDTTEYTPDTLVSNLYAKWEKDTSSSSKTATYTIKFNGNGATSGSMPALKSCRVGTKYKLTANKFIRKGYKFTGWSLSKNGTVKYKNKASVKNLITKNGGTVTLYAVWKKN